MASLFLGKGNRFKRAGLNLEESRETVFLRHSPHMQLKTVWQQGSSNPENADNFATICQWWANLANKKVTWQQRLIPQNSDVSQLDWEPQRFDEAFELKTPEIRGITVYWRKPDSPQERNTTPYMLELDNLRQQLYIYPQSQKQLVIRVGIPEVVYQTIELKNPQLQLAAAGEKYILTLRDAQQLLQVKVTLSPENLDQLKQQLSS